jgi:hypothetical protein
MGLDQLKWLQHLPNQLGSYKPCMASCPALSWYPLLGHKDVKTTMIYTHALNRGGRGVVSPLDR